MDKLDYKMEMKEFYFPSSKEASIVDVPAMKFVMADGYGDPNTSPLFQEVLQALYGVSFTIKFMLKGEKAREYVVPPLEGLWWMDDMTQFSMETKDQWKWTLMIRQPEWVEKEHYKKALEIISGKKGCKAPKLLDQTRWEIFREGLSAQIMHIGPYEAEAPTIQKLHQFISENNYERRDKHHEIYMSDPRKAQQEKMKTVIRQPVGK